MLQLRGCNVATVKDLIDIRKVMMSEMWHLMSDVAHVSDEVREVAERIDRCVFQEVRPANTESPTVRLASTTSSIGSEDLKPSTTANGVGGEKPMVQLSIPEV